MTKYEVDFYEKETGDCPVEEFLDSLNNKMIAKIIRVVDMLENNGPQIRMPHSEHLEDGIFEIRAKQGSNITRILYFFYTGKRIILTNGFTKTTQKTPKKEIETAKKYRKDYLRRFKDESL